MSRRHRFSSTTHLTLAGVSVALGLLACSTAAFADPIAPAGYGTQRNCNAKGHRYHCKSFTIVDAQKNPMVISPNASPKAGSSSLTAAQIASLYQLDTTRTPGTTIAIVDAYGYAKAESDLAGYRTAMKLPPCTVASGCLTIVNQEGKTSPLPPAPPKGDDWTVETALDIDMASAVCPNCKILLVQADDDQGDGLNIAQQTAASLGASVISNSWGGADADGSGSTEGEPFFNVNPAINIFVATGDASWDNLNPQDPSQPTGPDYPSTSAYVIGVGGTNVMLTSAGARASETAWVDGGSSCSVIIPKPAYQASVVSAATCGFRAASDVAAIGGSPGVQIYNNGKMTAEEGTSVASPLVASVFALYGFSKSDPGFPYAHASAFYDVTSGNNVPPKPSTTFPCTSSSANKLMCNTATGWDGPTGIGTPIGTALAMIAPEPAAPPSADMATPPVVADMAVPPAGSDLSAPEGSDLAVPPGSHDLAVPAGDLAHAESDLAQAEDDLAVGTGGNGPAGGGGTGGGGGGTAGSGGSGGGNNGCGCTLGGANNGNGVLALPLMLALLGFVIIRRRRA